MALAGRAPSGLGQAHARMPDSEQPDEPTEARLILPAEHMAGVWATKPASATLACSSSATTDSVYSVYSSPPRGRLCSLRSSVGSRRSGRADGSCASN
jgi:hypothetical protein